jgi:hypothetical protein
MERLALFATLYDRRGTPLLKATSALHAEPLVSVLENLLSNPKAGGLQGEYLSTVMLDETYAQADGTIERHTQFPEDASQWILSGPHFFVERRFIKHRERYVRERTIMTAWIC